MTKRSHEAAAFAGTMKKGLHCCRPFDVADSGGFEPPTARFVAEYSIQLSYESVWCFYTRSPLVPD